MKQLCRSGLALLVLSMLSSSDVGRAWAQAPEATAAKPDAPSCKRETFRVLVDVGHTVQVPGAISARGVTEYEFNLRLAKAIEQKLTEAGFARTVLLITAGKSRRGLFERVVHANHGPADLFLSIHHDSVPSQFKETWEYEGKQRQFSDRFRGHSIFISHQNGDRTSSLKFARLLGLQLKERGLTYTPHYTYAVMGARRRELLDAEAGVYRYDQLIVLKNTRVPAVLLEAGSIVNRDEEVLLGTPEHQQVISAAVTEAVESFCVLRSKDPKDQIAARARVPGVPRPAAVAPIAAAAGGKRGVTAKDQASAIKRHEP